MTDPVAAATLTARGPAWNVPPGARRPALRSGHSREGTGKAATRLRTPAADTGAGAMR
ncbi:hypothetical protein [Streptomyces sp. NPDC048338]|uniref:hypothetical protein n=1 Tax=Streptomyces sp. NPDC048338 TaxID=3365536 RepID=UPI00371D457D